MARISLLDIAGWRPLSGNGGRASSTLLSRRDLQKPGRSQPLWRAFAVNFDSRSDGASAVFLDIHQGRPGPETLDHSEAVEGSHLTMGQ